MTPVLVKSLTGLLAGAVACVLLSGCTGSHRDAASVPERTQQSIIDLIQTPPELTQAVYLTSRQCLQAKGFSLPFGSASSSTATPSVTGVAGLFGDESIAESVGYSSTTKGETSPVDAFEASLPRSERDRFAIAYTGPEGGKEESITLSSGAQIGQSAEGCLAVANRAVYGSVTTGLRLVNFVNEIYAQVDDGKLGRVVRHDLPAYERCMHAAGYAVAGLNAAEVAVSRFGAYRDAGQPASQRERAMVSKDADCQSDSGLIPDTNSMFFTTASAWIVAHEGDIAARQEELTVAMQRAKKIIESF